MFDEINWTIRTHFVRATELASTKNIFQLKTKLEQLLQDGSVQVNISKSYMHMAVHINKRDEPNLSKCLFSKSGNIRGVQKSKKKPSNM